MTTAQDKSPLDLRAIREELTGLHGEAYWERLGELSGREDFQAFLKAEFPSQAPRWVPDVQRRDFLRLMSGSLAVAGLGACTRQPEEKILPFATSPEERIPGKPEFFATTMTLGAAALGLLVESHGGRPTKVEGNPDHPASRGATDGFAQAATLGLYDPDRSHSVHRAGQISTWEDFRADLRLRLDRAEATGGEGLALLVEDHASPTLDAQLAALQAKLPKLGLYRWSPVTDDAVRQGATLAFGEALRPVLRTEAATVFFSVDSDFLSSGLDSVRNARGFAEGRRGRTDATTCNRLYAIECAPNLTGAMADHRLTLKPSEVEPALRALAAALGVDVDAPTLSGRAAALVEAAAEDLRAAGSTALVTAGPWQPARVHALVFAINSALGAIGTTLELHRPAVTVADDHAASLRALVDQMRAGTVETLLMLGGNPVYDAPVDLDFGEVLKTVPYRAHVAAFEDETSDLCQWHVPRAHFLECWGDARDVDGTTSVQQPLIAPLYAGKTLHEIVALVQGEGPTATYDLVRAHWRGNVLPEDETAFERAWQQALHDGLVVDARSTPVAVTARALDLGASPDAQGGLELAFRPDASTWDGRFNNNAWLQETPRPLTRLTWDNAALVSPATAARIQVEDHDVLRLEVGGRQVEVAVLVVPGHADEVVSLHLGYGRTATGTLGRGVGTDVYPVRATSGLWGQSISDVTKTGRRHRLVGVQKHPEQEDRGLVRVATFDRFVKDHGHVFEHHAHDPNELSMYEGWTYDSYAWGMVIDLNACIGCNACMVACQSENNIPVVGKDEVAMGREMHWIRIDRYYEHDGDELDASTLVPDEVTALHQPVPCMHCEQAPCEVVCPVGATTHSPEGLNEMTYNRCVGTRYCSNNCPYKVRRFNFYKYADYDSEVLALGNNPDVTVRHRGVMEKCTYCVQRINQARIDAKKGERKIREGEVVTACQAVCPTRAITFGDINDEASAIAKLREEPHHYGLLEETGTRPRTTYLAKLSNPNPALARS